jgi:hypothetical protein
MYRPTRLHRLAESIPWNRFLGSLKRLQIRSQDQNMYLHFINFFYAIFRMILELQNLMLRGMQDWKLQCNQDLSTGNYYFFRNLNILFKLTYNSDKASHPKTSKINNSHTVYFSGKTIRNFTFQPRAQSLSYQVMCMVHPLFLISYI